jgi:hypothetical protein
MLSIIRYSNYLAFHHECKQLRLNHINYILCVCVCVCSVRFALQLRAQCMLAILERKQRNRIYARIQTCKIVYRRRKIMP